MIGQDDQFGRSAPAREPVREAEPPPVWPPRRPHVERDERPHSRADDSAEHGYAPRRGQDDDYDAAANGWRGDESYAAAPESYDRAPDPYARAQEPYDRGADPHGRAPAGYGREPHQTTPDHRGYDDRHVQPGPSYFGRDAAARGDQSDLTGRAGDEAHYAPYGAPTEPAFARPPEHYGDDRIPPRRGEAYPDGILPERDHGQAYDRDDFGPAPLTADEEDFVEPPRRRRFALIAAVFALAVVGTAGAYGYRTMYAAPRSGAPPVVRADGMPNKIAAANPAGDAGASKQIYDRLGERSQNERVVPREEQPVDIKDVARVTSPRVLVPAANPPPPNLGAAMAPPAMAQASSLPNQGDPKKIRTVTIRPDQGVSAESNTARAASPPPQPPRSATRSIQPPPSSTAAAPVALTPQTAAAPPAEPAVAPRRQALAAPATTASTGDVSGYVVQLSAQRSQDEAQASFRSAQAKYPNVLGARQPIIRKKDLGEKGVFYGAQVGPFASREEAVQLCEELKSAGGSCIVQRN